MITKNIIFFCVFIAVCCQLEQAILSQVYYPPPKNYFLTKKLNDVSRKSGSANFEIPSESTAAAESNGLEDIILPAFVRLKRSFFERDNSSEGNNAELDRVRNQMNNPNWIPEIKPRTSNKQTNEDY